MSIQKRYNSSEIAERFDNLRKNVYLITVGEYRDYGRYGEKQRRPLGLTKVKRRPASFVGNFGTVDPRWLRCVVVSPMPPVGSPRILLVEDERHTAAAVTEWLEKEGFCVTWSGDGADGLELLTTEAFDAAIVDWMIPEVSGLDLLKKIRSEGRKIPVLLLTARDAVEDRIRGLDSGADDYLVKPFAVAELAARVRALMRRGPDQGNQPRIWRLNDLEVDEFTHTVTRGTTPISLTGKEFQILVLLLQNLNRVVSRETLTREVWNGMRRATPLDNVIDVHLANLRRKLEDGQSERLIQTVRGVGFVLRSA